MSNLLFVGSLGLSGYSFFSDHQMSLGIGLAISGVILCVKAVDWLRKQDLSPRKPKLSNRSAWI